MNKHPQVSPFNSALETGVRSLAILEAAYPSALDIERLVEMDYLVVHSGDVGGPDSLHAALPLRAGEMLVRRGLIEAGLLLMMSRGLINRMPTSEGITYSASDSASPFLSSIGTGYSTLLQERARWAAVKFANTPTEEIRKITHQFFERWSSQFQPKQIPGNGS